MKKSFALLGAISFAVLSAGLFASCSSSSSGGGKSLAEKCAGGVTDECLESATWSMDAFYLTSDGVTFTVAHKLSTPTTIEFKSDKKDGKTFELKYSSDAAINGNNDGLGGEESGSWSIEGNVLTMNFKFGDILGSNFETVQTALPLVALDSATTAINFGANSIHKTGFPGYEIFTGIEK